MENKVIVLSTEQRETLEKFANTGAHSAKLIKRAKTILALDRSNKKEHLRINRICEQIGISRQALNVIRQDFISSETIEKFLQRKKRETPPVAPKITGDVEARIIALACLEVPEGHAKWSLKFLAERSVELGIIDTISDMSIHRVLKKHNINLT